MGTTITLGQVILPPDVEANKPAASEPGRLYFATDSGIMYRDSGSVWTPVASTPPPTVALKKGTGAGNYTTASTSYVDVDATNLAWTGVIPLGWKLLVDVNGSAYSVSGTPTYFLISLYDSATLIELPVQPTIVGAWVPFSLLWVIAGDGNSHTVKLQFKTPSGASPVGILNASATSVVAMTFHLTESN